MKLAQLLKKSDVKVWQKDVDLTVDITFVTLDSRACAPNTVFIAAPGATVDSKNGHAFIGEALKRGASAIVVENTDSIPSDVKVPVLISSDNRKLAASWSEQICGFPSRRMAISGVTGTNGKTSVTFFLASILKSAGFRSSVLGTLGIGDPENPHYTGFTTPEAEVLSPALAQLCDQGFSHVAMEVSSHALELSRCDAIHFAAAAFLNLSPDHLDFHGDMANYRKAKERLFVELLPSNSPAVVPFSDQLVKTLRARGAIVLTFGRTPDADIFVDEVSASRAGTRARIHLGPDSKVTELPVFGDFNLDNVLCAAGLAYAQGVASEVIFDALQTISPPPGRLERIPAQQPTPLVLIDFAHTPDALQKVLKTTRAFSKGSLRLVFGCGGDRDRQKRPVMGEIAVELADEIWITNDNPRCEDPGRIIDEICDGIDPAMRYKIKVVPDRANAIAEAIQGAHLDDTVLIAGKGHEATQQVGDVFFPFSDRDVARETLEGWRK